MKDLESRYKTSWSDEQLGKLTIPANHKINYDGYEYWWYHKINGKKWELHFINGSESAEKLIEFLRYSLNVWSIEAKDRLQKQLNKGMRALKQDVEITQTYISVAKRKDLSISEKINLMNQLHTISHIEDVATILKVTPMYIRNHLKKL